MDAKVIANRTGMVYIMAGLSFFLKDRKEIWQMCERLISLIQLRAIGELKSVGLPEDLDDLFVALFTGWRNAKIPADLDKSIAELTTKMNALHTRLVTRLKWQVSAVLALWLVALLTKTGVYFVYGFAGCFTLYSFYHVARMIVRETLNQHRSFMFLK